MKPSTLLVPALALASTATAGPIALVTGAGGCLALCATAFGSCHAVGHGLSVFTFGFTSFLAVTSCHQVFIACEAQCMSNILIPAVAAPI
jgi:hypothetical protein